VLPEQLFRGDVQDIASVCSCQTECGHPNGKLYFLQVEWSLSSCGCKICIPHRWALKRTSAHSAVGDTISTDLS